ncbi:MAG: dTMP kinase [Candidatus Altiarchaeales archaeon IMC4]|nr:MAG: dTMP kinase [Candidatus Altiarchaeales archaeon IMC4]
MFIVLEGIDGCGKSTYAGMLVDWLNETHCAILTTEPTKNRIGSFIREILKGHVEVDAKTLALLFTADRYEHQKEIKDSLDCGKIVVCERYYHSTIAYQSALGVDKKWIVEMNKFARKPDLALFIDVDPEVAVKRTSTNEIFENLDFLKKVRENYMKQEIRVNQIDSRDKHLPLANDVPKLRCSFADTVCDEKSQTRVTVIDGNGTIGEVFERIKKRVDNGLC